MIRLLVPNLGFHSFPDKWDDMSAEEKSALIAGHITEEIWKAKYEDAPNWTGFRHDLEDTAAYGIIMSSLSLPGGVSALLVDQLRQEDYPGVIGVAAVCDSILHFTPEQKSEVNDAAAANFIGTIFE